MYEPGPRTRTRAAALLGALGLLAVSAAVWAAAAAAARRRRADTTHPLDRIWHPQESVRLTPAEEEAFDEVVAHLTNKAKR